MYRKCPVSYLLWYFLIISAFRSIRWFGNCSVCCPHGECMSSVKCWIVLLTSKFFVVIVWVKSQSRHRTLKIAFLIDEELRDKIIFLLLDDGRGANLLDVFKQWIDERAWYIANILSIDYFRRNLTINGLICTFSMIKRSW